MAAALCAYAVVLFAPQVLNDGDTWWHLATGLRILQTGVVPDADPFSHTMAGRPWQAHEWLSEVLMALAYRAAGWGGLVMLVGLAAGGAVLTLGAWLARFLRPLSVLVVLALVMGLAAGGLLARPHVLTLPVVAAWTCALLLAREKDRAPPLWLAGLMVLWANMHGGYVFGLALIGPFALEALVAAPRDRWVGVIRGWGAFGVLSLAAALVTPHGIEGLLFPFQVMTLDSLPGIAEWRATDFSSLGPLEIALLASLFVLLTRGVQVPALRLLVVLLLLHMALQHVRHQMLLGLVGALVLAEPLGGALNGGGRTPVRAGRWLAAVGLAALLALSTVRLAVPLVRTDGLNAPVSALAAVPPALAQRPVLNAYGFGGFLIFNGVRPYIDGRADMYGDAFTGAFFRMADGDSALLDQAIARHGVEWALLEPGSPLARAFEARAGWTRLHADRQAVVYARSTSAPPSTTR